jgi:hypothetical protein
MASTIFYSWQSDLPNSVNRGFIEDALEKAIRQLNKDLTVEESPREEKLTVDKDTKGVPGSPPIVDAIFQKIANACVFVPDVTFVGQTEKTRPLPNPNVLIEYGWAIRELGYSKIVAVMNSAFGEPSWDTLPFDMRHVRWPITYHLPLNSTSEQKVSVRDGLVKALYDALLQIVRISASSATPASDAFAHAIPSTWSASAFWEINQPFAQLPVRSDGSPHLIRIHNAEQIYLRLIPSAPIEIADSATAVELIKSGGLFPMTSRVFSLYQGRNKYGAFVYSTNNYEDEEIWNVTQLFRTGELWGIDAYTINKEIHMKNASVNFGFIACLSFEAAFVNTLEKYLRFARQTLNLSLPLKLVAGLTRVQGFKMAMPGTPWERFQGHIVEPDLNYSVLINDYETPSPKILRPFFEYVWRECGLTRPEVERLE